MFLQIEYGFDWDESIFVWLSQSFDVVKIFNEHLTKVFPSLAFQKSLGILWTHWMPVEQPFGRLEDCLIVEMEQNNIQ